MAEPDFRYKRVRLAAIDQVGCFVLIENAFNCNLSTYYYKNHNDVCKDIWILLATVRGDISLLLSESLARYGAIKYNILIELTYEKPNVREYRDVGFKTRNFEIFNEYDIEDSLQEAFEIILVEEANFEGRQSGWSLLSIDGILVRINRYRPLRGSCFIPLPKSIQDKHAIINIKNNDDYCFKWAILCKFVKGKNRDRIDKRYDAFLNKFNFESLNFPSHLTDVYTFEKINSYVSVNVFSLDENQKIIPIKVCSFEKEEHFDLLLLTNGNHQHFCFISDFERLIRSQLTKNKNAIKICKRCFTFYKNDENCSEKMIDHLERCRINPPAKVLLPVSKDDGSQPVLKFKNFHHIFPLPIVCYADFECILKPVATCCPNPKNSYTVSTEKL